MGLEDKLEKAKRLGKKLKGRLALQEQFPDVFGPVSLRLTHEGRNRRPMILMLKNGEEKRRVPLIEIPVIVMRSWAASIGIKARSYGVHRDWRVANEMMKTKEADMPKLTFPMEVTVQMKDEFLIEDMDGYDADSEDEESVSWLGVEQGNSMETIDVESMEDLHGQMTGEYSKYVISDDDVSEEYREWKANQE